MKILALAKYSLDAAEIKVSAGGALRMTGVPRRFGNLDKGVVEAAVKLKEACGASVEVLCFGPDGARSAVRDLLAMGAEEATVIEDPGEESADPIVALRVLEAAIRKRGPFDLILCGFASDDGYSYQIGPRLAERLALPLVSYACQLRVDGGTLIAEQDLDDGLRSVSVPLPAIASVAEEAFEPRPVTLLQAMTAQRKPTRSWRLAEDLGLTAGELGQVSSSELLGETGVVVQREQCVLKGPDLAELADRLIDRLAEAGILDVAGAR